MTTGHRGHSRQGKLQLTASVAWAAAWSAASALLSGHIHAGCEINNFPQKLHRNSQNPPRKLFPASGQLPKI
jgi:hypothetical protein